MSRYEFLSKNWIGSCSDYQKSNWILTGIPFDGTCSYRPGTRFAPQEIRLASWGLETYSPVLDKDLNDISFYDYGDLDLAFGNTQKVLATINSCVYDILKDNKKFFGIGGEHLVTLPVIEAYLKKYPKIVLVHFDAHTDLREEYLGEKYSHACVVRHIANKIGPENLIQIGIRSGEKSEFEYMYKHNTLIRQKDELLMKLNSINANYRIKRKVEDDQESENIPIFITVDIDVLDPSILPGTGTPEAGGFSYNELISWLSLFKEQNIVGCDVVELSPHYDSSGISTAVTAKLIREMLLMFAS